MIQFKSRLVSASFLQQADSCWTCCSMLHILMSCIQSKNFSGILCLFSTSYKAADVA